MATRKCTQVLRKSLLVINFEIWYFSLIMLSSKTIKQASLTILIKIENYCTTKEGMLRQRTASSSGLPPWQKQTCLSSNISWLTRQKKLRWWLSLFTSSHPGPSMTGLNASSTNNRSKTVGEMQKFAAFQLWHLFYLIKSKTNTY